MYFCLNFGLTAAVLCIQQKDWDRNLLDHISLRQGVPLRCDFTLEVMLHKPWLLRGELVLSPLWFWPIFDIRPSRDRAEWDSQETISLRGPLGNWRRWTSTAQLFCMTAQAGERTKLQTIHCEASQLQSGLSVQGGPRAHIIPSLQCIMEHSFNSFIVSFLFYRSKATRVVNYCFSGLKGLVVEISWIFLDRRDQSRIIAI